MSPGTWLSDLSQERYEVREKKSSKKVFYKIKKTPVFILVDFGVFLSFSPSFHFLNFACL